MPTLIDSRRNNDIYEKISVFIEHLEQSIDILFEERHSFPVWPLHDRSLNAFEEAQHGYIRQMYYDRIRTQIKLLRRLRAL